jgi:argininosuccinate lyase
VEFNLAEYLLVSELTHRQAYRYAGNLVYRMISEMLEQSELALSAQPEATENLNPVSASSSENVAPSAKVDV